jgi:hypothetical protein
MNVFNLERPSAQKPLNIFNPLRDSLLTDDWKAMERDGA